MIDKSNYICYAHYRVPVTVPIPIRRLALFFWKNKRERMSLDEKLRELARKDLPRCRKRVLKLSKEGRNGYEKDLHGLFSNPFPGTSPRIKDGYLQELQRLLNDDPAMNGKRFAVTVQSALFAADQTDFLRVEWID